MLEKIIHKRIMNYLLENEILSNCQFGFQKGLSTYMPLVLLQESVTKAFESGKTTVAIYLDLKKAFDTVDNDILIEKLKLYGFQSAVLNLISSYLTDRQQCVEYDGARSNFVNINVGVPQGSVLGPLLFLLYINDMPNVCKQAKFLLFADDTVVIFENKNINRLQIDLDTELPDICEWLKANKLSLNTKKTVCQIYSNSRTEIQLNVLLNNETIPAVEKVKYLGIIIDRNLNWGLHIHQLSSMISRNIGIMNRSKFYLDKSSLKLLYNALVLPYINYCCLVWGFTFPSYIHKLILLQKRAVRIIAHEHRLANTEPIFKDLKLLKVNDIAKQQLILLMHRKLRSELPRQLNELFSFVNPGSITTRNRHHFCEPFTEKLYRTRVCSWNGPRIWNKIISPYHVIDSARELSKHRLKKIVINYLQENSS